MTLTATGDTGVVDAFGINFTMEERGRIVRCHVFRAAVEAADGLPAHNDGELLSRFQRHRTMFERLAGNLYDAGHRTPWIEAFSLPE